MKETKYWLEVKQGQDYIDIDFENDYHRRQAVIEAFKSANVTTYAYESYIDVGEGE